MTAPLEMCTPTHSCELAQVTSQDVPSRELAPNTNTYVFSKVVIILCFNTTNEGMYLQIEESELHWRHTFQISADLKTWKKRILSLYKNGMLTTGKLNHVSFSCPHTFIISHICVNIFADNCLYCIQWEILLISNV